MRRHLDAGDLRAAKQCLRFDDGLMPRLQTLAAGLHEAGYKLEAAELLAFGIFHLKGQAGRSHHMLAWVYHEIGRTTEAIRIALDSFEACDYRPSSDTDLIEYNLMLAELLMVTNRTDEANGVILKLKTHAANDWVIQDRCAQVLAFAGPNPLAWFTSHKTGEMFAHFDQSNRAIRTTSLRLTNMDRYRGLFPAHR
jgi:hypothetical protein